MSQQKAGVSLLLNVFLYSLVCAQYGSPAGNSNPGYGGTDTNVPSGGYAHKGQNPVEGPSRSDGNSEPEPFNFTYQVKDVLTNTYFMHEADSDGKRVTGAYSVLLPDGRNQVVTYVADENGYNAKVNYEGEAIAQPSQPGSQSGYLSAPDTPSTPKYPPTPMAGYGFHRSAAHAINTPALGQGSDPSSALGFLVRIPTFSKGDNGSSRPKSKKGSIDYDF